MAKGSIKSNKDPKEFKIKIKKRKVKSRTRKNTVILPPAESVEEKADKSIML